MVVVPRLVPVTTPLLSTVATVSSLEVQTTSLLSAYQGSQLKVSCWLLPTPMVRLWTVRMGVGSSEASNSGTLACSGFAALSALRGANMAAVS